MNQTHSEYMRVTFAFSKALGIVSIPLASSAALFAYLVIGTVSAAAIVGVGILFAAGLLVAATLIGSMQTVHWMLVEVVAAGLDRKEGTTTYQTHVDARGIGNEVQINNAPVVQETIRLVPFKGSARLVDGVPEEDLREFVERIFLIGHSKRAWLGQSLRSGRTIATQEEYQALIAPVEKSGFIVGRGERRAGQLVAKNPEEIKKNLGL